MDIREMRVSALSLLVFCLCALCACSSYRAERHYKKGVACQKNNETVKAIEEFTRTLYYVPGHIPARLAIAAAYESQELWDKALDAYSEVLRYDPMRVEADYALGNIYSRLHRWDEALASFETVVQKDPVHAGAYYALGSIFKMHNKNGDAIAAYRKTIEIDEEYCEAHYQLSLLYFIKGDFKHARSHADVAQKELPAAEKLIMLIEEETNESKG